MTSYLRSERIKDKHSFSKRLVIIAPIITLLLAFLMGGTYNLQAMSMYWWYAFILCGLIAILCGISIQKEQRAGKFYSVYAQPIRLSRFWIAKCLSCSLYVIAASILIGLLIVVASFFGLAQGAISPAQIMLGASAVAVASLWQVPLCLWLAAKVGIFLPMITNTVFGLFSTFFTTSGYWWAIPYTWASKICEPITGIKSSGDIATTNEFSMEVVPIILCLSLVLFVIITFIGTKWFAKQEVK